MYGNEYGFGIPALGNLHAFNAARAVAACCASEFLFHYALGNSFGEGGDAELATAAFGAWITIDECGQESR